MSLVLFLDGILLVALAAAIYLYSNITTKFKLP